MSDQNPNVELNKEEEKLIVENNSVENTENGPKAVKKPSTLLSISFYLALTYILLFMYFAFYQDAFGFKELRRKDFPDYAFTIVYLGLDGDDYELELTYNYDHGPYVVGDGFAHIALSTPDLEALHKEHSEKGYEVTEPKGLSGTQPNYYFIKDPDGYKVEVIREK